MSMNQRVHVGIIITTTVIVLLLAGVISLNLLSDNPYKIERFKQIKARGPTSIAAIGAGAVRHIDENLPTTGTVALKCLKRGRLPLVTSSANQIRLTGRLCSASDLTQSDVVNKTNGFIATTFKLKEKQFSTDYIDLSPGENKVLITLEDSSGERVVSELVINKL